MPNPTTYETGTCTNTNHLLQKLETFAVGMGWTIDKSVVGEPYTDTDITPNFLSQSGEILAGSTPWYSNRADGTFTIATEVIEFTQDSGSNYHVILPIPSSVGEYLEIRFEIITAIGGTLQLMFGDGTNKLSSTAVGLHRFTHTMGAGEYLRFESDDFRGSFKLIAVIKKAPVVQLSLHKDNVGYFHLKSGRYINSNPVADPGSYMYLNGSSGYTEGNDYNAHPGASPDISKCNLLDEYYNGGNFHAYYFFGTANHIYIVIEPWEGEFSHMGFGVSRKYFDFRGGNFTYGTVWRGDGNRNDPTTSWHSYPMGFYHYYSNYNSYRADLVGTPIDKWLNETGQPSGYPLQRRLLGTNTGYSNQDYQENPYYGTSPLVPIYMAGADINGYQYSLGEMEEYRQIFCKYIDPKTELAINGELWKVFPAKRKQLTTPDEYVSNSTNHAIAYYIGDAPE